MLEAKKHTSMSGLCLLLMLMLQLLLLLSFCVLGQVTTIRSSGKKTDIPLMTDPVSKIQAIGKETVAKLENLTAAAAASSDTGDSDILQDFCAQCNSITTGKLLTKRVTSPVVIHHCANLNQGSCVVCVCCNTQAASQRHVQCNIPWLHASHLCCKCMDMLYFGSD